MKPPHKGGPAKGGSHRPSGQFSRSSGPPPDRGGSRAGSKPGGKPGRPPSRGDRPAIERGGDHRTAEPRQPSANTLTAPRRETSPPRPPEPQRYDAPRPEAPRRRESSVHRDSPQRAGGSDTRGAIWLYGVHAVAAALDNPARRARRLLLTEDAEAAISARVRPPWPLQPERADRARLELLLGRDVTHQGAALLAYPLTPPSLAQALERPGPVLVLDQISDPRNVGAILRSAAAFGVAAVITQDRNSPEETGALAKAASGALEKLPLFRAVNIARTLVALKAAGCWVIGLDAGAAALSGPALRGRRVALVLGSEGEGLRRLTRETCDELAGVAMPVGNASAMESLNVAAAAAIALYEVSKSA